MKRSPIDEVACVEDLAQRFMPLWADWIRDSHASEVAVRQQAVIKAAEQLDLTLSGADIKSKRARWPALAEAVCMRLGIPYTDRVTNRIFVAVNTRNAIAHGELSPERGQALAAVLVCAWVVEVVQGAPTGGGVLGDLIAYGLFGQSIPPGVGSGRSSSHLGEQDIRRVLVQRAYRKNHLELLDVVRELRHDPGGKAALADPCSGDFRPRPGYSSLLHSFRQMRDDPNLEDVGRHLLAMAWCLETRADERDVPWFEANFLSGVGPVDPDFFRDFDSPAFQDRLLTARVRPGVDAAGRRRWRFLCSSWACLSAAASLAGQPAGCWGGVVPAFHYGGSAGTVLAG